MSFLETRFDFDTVSVVTVERGKSTQRLLERRSSGVAFPCFILFERPLAEC